MAFLEGAGAGTEPAKNIYNGSYELEAGAGPFIEGAESQDPVKKGLYLQHWVGTEYLWKIVLDQSNLLLPGSHSQKNILF